LKINKVGKLTKVEKEITSNQKGKLQVSLLRF